MGGGPSQVDTFDPKPVLATLDGQDVPESIARDVPRIARSPLDEPVRLAVRVHAARPERHPGLGDLFPRSASCVDDICVLRSCRHDSPIHAPAEYLATTGTQIGDRPSLGSWLTTAWAARTRTCPASSS